MHDMMNLTFNFHSELFQLYSVWIDLALEMERKKKGGTLSVEEENEYKAKIDDAYEKINQFNKASATKIAKAILEKLDLIRQNPEIFYFSEEYLIQLENSPLENLDNVNAALELYNEAWLDSVCRMYEQMIQNFESLRTEKEKIPDDEDPLGRTIKAFRECHVKAFLAKAEFIENKNNPPKTTAQMVAELEELSRKFDSIGEHKGRTIN
ncbi:hypothetical protein HQ571_01870 [Candidatus Kuenenbacteria bacterium]|nr:hypothetical protein [Candidatus Kuenenbacteria bacterium]